MSSVTDKKIDPNPSLIFLTPGLRKAYYLFRGGFRAGNCREEGLKIYDISVTISEALPTWPGDPALSIELASSMARGDEANVTRLCLGAHTGTHIDAPSHFEPNGLGVDALPLDILIGPCRVFDLTGEPGPIGRGALSRCAFQGVSRALFKTKNSDLWHQTENRFQKGFIGIAPEGAALLVERGLRLAGIDYLSIEPFQSPGHPTHHLLLQNGVVILEGLDLKGVPPGDYELMALPIKIRGADGAPVRAVLRAPT